jgi:hypothetical protein
VPEPLEIVNELPLAAKLEIGKKRLRHFLIEKGMT